MEFVESKWNQLWNERNAAASAANTTFLFNFFAQQSKEMEKCVVCGAGAAVHQFHSIHQSSKQWALNCFDEMNGEIA